MKTFLSVLACAVLVLVTGALSQVDVPFDTVTSRAPTGFVAEITLDGAIGPAAAEYFDNAMERAVHDGAIAVVLRMDTPGGLSASMRQIVSRILASPIPVLGYVAPEGARAASAGTYILYACQIAAMAPATHLGAATPVSLGSPTPMPAPAPTSRKAIGRPSAQPAPGVAADTTVGADAGSDSARAANDQHGDAEAHKVLNDAIAYIRSLAQLRGRDAEWAEQAVRGAATLTASEAASRHVIDFVSNNVSDLLRQSSGQRVKVGERTVTLALTGHTVRAYDPNWRTTFLSIITQPTIAYILLLAGIYGLVLEAFHPGVFFPGVTGGICLLIGLYALQMLPVNYAGLALMALGLGLLIAEVVSPTVGALGIGGIIAFVIGSIMLFNTSVPGYAVNLGIIGGIAFCAIALLALLLFLVMRARRARQVSGDQQMIGASGEVLEPTASDGEGWALVNGERWRIRSDTALPAGARVRVLHRQGLVLWVVQE
jgi:membrane-bound serine protease (ClpP class)